MLFAILSFLSGVVESGIIEPIIPITTTITETIIVTQEASLADFLNSLGGLVTAFIAAAIPLIGILYSATRFFRAKAIL